MPLLTGKTAVITGGAQGLGFAIAQCFVAEGARVVLGDVNGETTQVAAKQLGGESVARAVQCDVTNAAEVEALIAAAVDGFGGLDIMVNNAGITRDATLRKMTEEQFDQVIAVHLKGTWNGLRAASAVMREAKSGAIVNMSSASARPPNPLLAVYSSTKGFVESPKVCLPAPPISTPVPGPEIPENERISEMKRQPLLPNASE